MDYGTQSGPCSLFDRFLPLILLGFLAAAPATAKDDCKVRFEGVAAEGSGAREAPCLLADSGGYVVVARHLALGANRAVLISGESRFPVPFVAGDLEDAGLLQLWAEAGGRFQPAEKLSTANPQAGDQFTTGDGQSLALESVVDTLSSGEYLRLKSAAKHQAPAKLFSSAGETAALLTCRVVNGGELHFAVPAARLLDLRRQPLVTIEEWTARGGGAEAGSADEFLTALGYLWHNDYDGAEFYLGRYLESHPKHARAWFHRGFAAGKLGSAKRKTDFYTRAVALDPQFAEARYNLGISLVLSGNKHAATAQVEALKNLNPDLADRLAQIIEAIHVDSLEDLKKTRVM